MHETCGRHMRKGLLVLAIMGLIVPFCGCITGEGVMETGLQPTTTAAPPSTYIFPTYAYQLQEKIAETEAACEAALHEWNRSLEAFRAMAVSTDSSQDGLLHAFGDYDAAIREYERLLMEYYRAQLLLEHTETTESGLLALKKDTVPFDRPDGLAYSYEVLNMGAEGYMAHEGDVKLLIMSGNGGQESFQELLDAIDKMEEYLLEYHDMIIGYVYHEMSRYLNCLSLYSDGLVDYAESCNPLTF